MRLAGHLCGARCQEVLEGNSTFVRELSRLGFGRVQVNATSANAVYVSPDSYDRYVANLTKVMNEVPEMEFIMQFNEETSNICHPLLVTPPKNMSVLFDASCGLGVTITSFPPPPVNTPCGYAGGIGPETIANVLGAIQLAAKDTAVWIDMESSLRAKITSPSGIITDVFSIEKCFACVLVGLQFGLPASRFKLVSI